MLRPRVFISHSHTDDIDAIKTATDLIHSGAEVWIDKNNIASGDFINAINQALISSDWVVLILSPEAVTSNFVRFEMNSALLLSVQGKIKGIIPFIVKECDLTIMPISWQVLQTYDAVQSYKDAYIKLCNVIGVSSNEIWSEREDKEDRLFRLLIVDDSPDLHHLMRLVLEENFQGKLEVYQATDGISGLEQFYQLRPDCVIIDYMMPGLNGYQLVRAIRADPKTAHTILIVHTTHRDTKDMFESEGLIDYFYVKPFQLDEMITLLNSLIMKKE